MKFLTFEFILLRLGSVGILLSYLLGYVVANSTSPHAPNILQFSGRLQFVEFAIRHAPLGQSPAELNRIVITFSLMIMTTMLLFVLMVVSGALSSQLPPPFKQDRRSFMILLSFNFLAYAILCIPNSGGSKRLKILMGGSDARYFVFVCCTFFLLPLAFMLGRFFTRVLRKS